jgi:chromate transport protein ChrA
VLYLTILATSAKQRSEVAAMQASVGIYVSGIICDNVYGIIEAELSNLQQSTKCWNYEDLSSRQFV